MPQKAMCFKSVVTGESLLVYDPVYPDKIVMGIISFPDNSMVALPLEEVDALIAHLQTVLAKMRGGG